MKLVICILFLVGLFVIPSGQESPGTDHGTTPSVGLAVGKQAPAFALPDQFGHEQSNETLKDRLRLQMRFAQCYPRRGRFPWLAT